MKKPLIILTGPTAVGKTELSIRLAEAAGGAVISADSMQVYKYMDIGSAKITKEQMQGVRHYLIDEFLPDEEFNVVQFQKYARKYMEEIYQNGQIPIITGGTGFYIQAVLYDIDFSRQDANGEYRKELAQTAEQYGTQRLHQMLLEVDPAAAGSIHPNNKKRLIRALEFYRLTGGRISEHNEREHKKQSPYQSAYFVLNDIRSRLYERIDRRVDEMMENGLLNEVQRLKDMGYTKDLVSMQGLGYKELFPYFDKECTLDEAVSVIKRDTRHFAKRQLTWFRREKDVIWVNKDMFSYDNDKILAYMNDILRERGIINKNYGTKECD
ncbi:MAG: tRNA (adenosine(37)-N6)-dimethylallyltransferase MiaA [Eubacterium sp.]|nr:tRNA (adenosine(37)-N6)-dimethylallyltransferase MiaA [Eubacterium sp.]MCI8918118.1 tRNA (adenosine(37)-N6)-dimethylallyltransferase MiaA [Eubacterium sp.]